MRALEWTAIGAVGTFTVIAFLYVFVSHVVARLHHSPANAWNVIKQAIGELLVVLASQPLLLPYFLLGRRMGGRKKGTPVVFIHGYFQNRGDFVYVAHVLRKRGLGPLYGMNYWSFGRIEAAANRLGRFVERVRTETGADKVDLVCHSLGGVVAGEYLRTGPKDASEAPAYVRKCVTLASPHAGVAWPGPIVGKTARILRRGSRYLQQSVATPFGVPALSIYSSFDNIVYPMETSALSHRGGTDQVLEHVGHLAILFDRRAAAAVADFLDGASPPREP